MSDETFGQQPCPSNERGSVEAELCDDVLNRGADTLAGPHMDGTHRSWHSVVIWWWRIVIFQQDK